MTCKGCGKPLQKTATTGYCRSNPTCRSNNIRIFNARAVAAARRRRYRLEHPDVQMYHTAKHRAKRLGIPFTITQQDIRDIWADTCPVFGYGLRTHQTGLRDNAPESYSLDRIDPAKGYVPGNIQILSQRANAMKSDATPEELVRFADWVYATYRGGDG